MKITNRQLRRIIKETLLLEEPADYYKDYKAGTITKSEYEQLVRDFERGGSARPSNPTAPARPPQSISTPGKKWKGSKEDLTKKVHGYLIDIGFYKESHDGYVNPFSKGSHPEGGYTSSIPKVLKDGIASGDIDWATYDEMYPVYRAIDRSID